MNRWSKRHDQASGRGAKRRLRGAWLSRLQGARVDGGVAEDKKYSLLFIRMAVRGLIEVGTVWCETLAYECVVILASWRYLRHWLADSS